MTTIFQKAKNIIKEAGWIQGEYRDLYKSTGKFAPSCLLGACVQARMTGGVTFYDELDRFEASQEFRDLTSAVHAMGAKSVPSWNDEEGRSLDEVLALLDSMPVPDECVQPADAPSVIPV